MPPVGYLLSQKDRDKIAKLLAKSARQVHQARPSPSEDFGYSSEVLLTQAPLGIPAFDGFNPGTANLQLFKLYQSLPGDPYSIVGLTNPDSSPYKVDVYNIYPIAHQPSAIQYIRVTREKISGRWLCDAPAAIGYLVPCYFNADLARGDSVSAQLGYFHDGAWDYTLVTAPVYDESRIGPAKAGWRGWTFYSGASGRWELLNIERSPSALWVEFTVKNAFDYPTLNIEGTVTRYWEGPDPGPNIFMTNLGPQVGGKYVYRGKVGLRGRAQFDRENLVYRLDYIECQPDEAVSENPPPTIQDPPPQLVAPPKPPVNPGRYYQPLSGAY